jgi:hypothetical protein
MIRPHPLARWSAAAVVVCCAALTGCSAIAGHPAPCGPQSPRDLAVAGGTNELPVPGDGTRPPRLCNVHFHRPAEHTGIGACPAVEDAAAIGVCAGGGAVPVRPGEEIEFHWVYTSCPRPAEPRPGLGNCVCDEPVLMVFGQKYVVSGEAAAGVDTALTEPAADLARYGGSTTGPSYGSGRPDDPKECSPARVQWAVARQCRALALSTLGTWCGTNDWREDHAHGARPVIAREDWLSPYVPEE